MANTEQPLPLPETSETSRGMRILDALVLWTILLGLSVVTLFVDPNCRVPFLDEKFALLHFAGGLLGILLAIRVVLRGIPLAVAGPLIALVPLAGIATWRFFVAFHASPPPGVYEPGYPSVVDSLIRYVGPFLAGIVLFATAGSLPMNGKARRVVLGALFFTLTVEVLGVSIEWLGGLLNKDWRVFLWEGAVEAGQSGLKANLFGSLGNTNFLASFLAILFPVGLAFSSSRGSRRSKIASGVVSLVLIFLVLACRSKGAILAVVAGSLVFSVWGSVFGERLRSGGLFRFRTVSALGVIGVVVLAIAFGLLRTGSWADTFRLRGESVAQRLLLAHVGLEQRGESPWVGIGPGQFRVRFVPKVAELLGSEASDYLKGRLENLKSFRPIHVHNDYLEILVEWGLVGYASALLFLILILVLAWQRLRAATPDERWFRLGCVASICAAMAYAVLEFPLHLPTHLMLIALLAGWSIAPERPSVESIQTSGFRWLRRGISGLVLLAVSVFLLGHGGRLYAASRLAREAEELAQGKESEMRRSVEYLRRASLLDPGNPDLGSALAQFEWRIEGDAGRARATLRRSSALSDDPNLRLVETELHIEEGNLDEAIRALGPLTRIGAYLPGVGYFEGRILEARGNTGDASKAYRRDIRARGNRPEVVLSNTADLYFRYATTLEDLGRYREALAAYQDHLDQVGDRVSNIPIARIRMGRIYRDKLNDFEAARTAFDEAQESTRKSGNPNESELVRREIEELVRLKDSLKAPEPEFKEEAISP